MTTLGNYKVNKLLGEGGFGRTYEVEHILLREKACLKQNITLSPEDEKLLIQEAKTIWNVHHYSLPSMRDFFKCPDGSYALVMSFVEGQSLDAIVDKHIAKKKEGLNPENVCWISQRLLNALQYLHYHGVVHGDVKPQNIIVNPGEHNATLVDFGLSSVRPKSTTAALGYTPAFSAPEVVAGKPPIPESDLYALGATMIYALGGNPIAKTYPKNTPEEIKAFFDELVLHDPRQRPNWKKTDLVKKLSDVREEIFGRRSSGYKKL